MNINFKLSNEVEEKINQEITQRLSCIIDELFKDDELVEAMIKEILKGQVKRYTLEVIQSNELKTRICQKVYPIVYKEFGV